MDFRSFNDFNVLINTLGGNFYPLDVEKQKWNFVIVIYAIFSWASIIIWVMSAVTCVVGHFVPPIVTFENSSVPCMLVLEVLLLSAYFNTQRKKLRHLISLCNRLLVDDDALKRCLNETSAPRLKSFRMYILMAMGSTIVWGILPLPVILTTNQYTYVDFIVPAWMPGEPFGINTFLCGVLIRFIGSWVLTCKKINTDLYISCFVLLLTAEYKYLKQQIGLAMSDENGNEKDETSIIMALQKCVLHQTALIEAGQVLVDLMEIHVGVTYIFSILRYCFLGYCFISFGDDYYRKFVYLGYGVGILIQVYLLCSCVQDLLDASTSITDDGFHADWHGRGSKVRKIFSVIEMSKNMECRLTAYGVVDLTTPTVALILNQAYSACLILLGMQ